MKPQVAIIGAGLGGLSAAIHLRLAGHPVTVFEANPRCGGRANRIERDGFTFDTGPSLLNYPWVFEELFSAAGKRFEDYVQLLPVDPSVQFRWPDGTVFTLSSDLKKLVEECERVDPGSGPGLASFLRDAGLKYDLSFQRLVQQNEDNFLKWMSRLSPRELWSTGIWHSLDAELRRFFKSRHIREAFGSYGMYLGGSPFDLPGLFTILPYGELAYGLWLPKGGVYGLVQGIEKLARELGVVIRTSAPVASVLREGRRVTGLHLRDGSTFDAGIVVSNVDVPATERILLGAAKPSSPRMTPGVLTFYWGIQGHVPSAGHHTIFLPNDYRRAFDQLCREGRVPEELPFYVSVASETDPELAPQGCSTVFVLVPAPVVSQERELNVQAIREQVWKRMVPDGPMPKVLFEEVWTPTDWRDRFGLHDGSAFGAAHTLFQVGPFRARNQSREFDGLFYTGAGTTPGTGMPMVTLSGRMTAQRIANYAG